MVSPLNLTDVNSKSTTTSGFESGHGPATPPPADLHWHPSIQRAGLPVRTVFENFLGKIQRGIERGKAAIQAAEEEKKPKWARKHIFRHPSDESNNNNNASTSNGRGGSMPGSASTEEDDFPIAPNQTHRVRGKRTARSARSAAAAALLMVKRMPPGSDELDGPGSAANGSGDGVGGVLEEKSDASGGVGTNPVQASSVVVKISENSSTKGPGRGRFASASSLLLRFCQPNQCVTDVLRRNERDIDVMLALAHNTKIRWSYGQVSLPSRYTDSHRHRRRHRHRPRPRNTHIHTHKQTDRNHQVSSVAISCAFVNLLSVCHLLIVQVHALLKAALECYNLGDLFAARWLVEVRCLNTFWWV